MLMTSGTRARLAALLTVPALAVGCGTGTDEAREAPPAAEVPHELGAHDGEPCPELLPDGEESPAPAARAPDLPAADRMWVCRYDLGDGSWERAEPAVEVDGGALTSVTEALGRLEPARADRMCTQELGPRWLVVWSHDTDLTGAVVDGFGCRDVRLTDEPYETVPGEASGSGIVPGVLAADGLLEAVQAAYDA